MWSRCVRPSIFCGWRVCTQIHEQRKHVILFNHHVSDSDAAYIGRSRARCQEIRGNHILHDVHHARIDETPTVVFSERSRVPQQTLKSTCEQYSLSHDRGKRLRNFIQFIAWDSEIALPSTRDEYYIGSEFAAQLMLSSALNISAEGCRTSPSSMNIQYISFSNFL